MIEFSEKLEQLEKKYKISLPEGFRAELLGIQARHHLEMMSLHIEMFAKPAMWRDCADSLKQTEAIALSMFAAKAEVAKAERNQDWFDKISLRLKRKGKA